MEAGPNTWHAYDIVEPLVARLVVADPRKLRAMAAGAPKTDTRDALLPAMLLAADMVPEVWVPPKAVREVRTLVHYRKRLVKRSGAARNRLHGLLGRLHVSPPEGSPFSASHRDWWATIGLSTTEELLVRQDLATIDSTSEQLEEVNGHLASLSLTDPWHDDATLLMHLPGFAVINAMTVLSAIGTVDRFPKSSKLVSYAGLDPRVHQSGESLRIGRISKQGRRELRTTMIQVAWTAVNSDDYWKERFAPLEQKLGTAKAITAIARKLLVVVWHVLTYREPGHHVVPEAVARTYLRWATGYRLATSHQLSRSDFVRREMLRLGLEHNAIRIRQGRWTLLLDAHSRTTADA
jgi:transposase